MSSEDESVRAVGGELLTEVSAIKAQLEGDGELLTQLAWSARSRRYRARRQAARRARRGAAPGKRRLSQLEQRVQRNIGLLGRLDARERLAIRLLIALWIDGGRQAAMALDARRVLKPLAAVTARAKAVARETWRRARWSPRTTRSASWR
jgi:hypothetical protein